MPSGDRSRTRIDDFLPQYDFSATYEIPIRARSDVVYQSLLQADFNDLWLVRLLMTLRSCRIARRAGTPRDLRERLNGTGFVILTEEPGDEIVIGVAGRFWRPDGRRTMDLRAEDFAKYDRPGDAKAAWNFKLRAGLTAGSILSTETRIQCFGRAALWKFRAYWTVVGPFSGVIRKAILKQVKTAAEAQI